MADKQKNIKINLSLENGKIVLGSLEDIAGALGEVSAQQVKQHRTAQSVADQSLTNTKQFSKQAHSLGGLVKSYAIVAANVFALAGAYRVLQNVADLSIMRTSAEELSRSTGVNFARVADNLKEITEGALDFRTAMQTANLGISGGATEQQIQRITEVATKAANALGRSVPESVTRMTQAVIKGEAELVDEFGIILRVGDAADKYAASIGKTAKELSAFERQQAVINQLLEQGEQKFSEVEIRSNPFDKLIASMKDVANGILEFLIKPFEGLANILADNSELLVGGMLILVRYIGRQVIPSFKALSQSFAENMEKMAVESIDSVNTINDSMSKIASESVDIKAARGDVVLDKANKELEESLKSRKYSAKLAGEVLISDFESVKDKLITGLNNAQSSYTRISVDILGKSVTLTQKHAREILGIVKRYQKDIKSATNPRIFTTNLDEMSRAVKFRVTDIKNNFKILTLAVKSSVSEVAANIGTVASARGIKASIEEFKNIERPMLLLGEEATRTSKALNSLSFFASKVGSAFVIAGKGIATAVSILTTWGLYAGIAYEAIKGLVNILGIWSDKAKKASDKIEELVDSFDDLSDSVSEISNNFADATGTIENTIQRYEQISNKVNEISGRIESGLGAFKDTESDWLVTYFERFTLLGGGVTDAQKALTEVRDELSLLQKLTRKEYDISVNTEDGRKGLEDIIDNISLINDTDVRINLSAQVSKTLKAARADAAELVGAIRDLEDSAKSVNKTINKDFISFKGSSPVISMYNDIERLNRSIETMKARGEDAGVIFGSISSALSQEGRALLGINSDSAKAAAGLSEVKEALIDINKANTYDEKKDILSNIINNSGIDKIPALNNLYITLEKLSSTRFDDSAESAFYFADALAEVDNIASSFGQAFGEESTKLQEGLKERERVLKQSALIQLQAKNILDQSKSQISIAEKSADIGNEQKIASFRRQSASAQISSNNELIKQSERLLDILNEDVEKNEIRIRLVNSSIKSLKAQNSLISLSMRDNSASVAHYRENINETTVELQKQKSVMDTINTNLGIQRDVSKDTNLSYSDRSDALQEALEYQKKLVGLAEGHGNDLKSQFILEKEILKNKELIATETGKLIEAEKARTDIIKLTNKYEKDLAKGKREVLNIAKQQLDLELKRIDAQQKLVQARSAIPDMARSVFTNEDLPASLRGKALDLYSSTIDSVRQSQLKLLDAKEAELSKTLETTNADRNSAEYIRLKTELLTTQIEKQAKVAEFAINDLDTQKEILEVRKQLADKGQYSFGKAFRQAMDLEAREFAKSVNKVDRAVNNLLEAVDKSIDSIVDNFAALANGELDFKEFGKNILEDITGVLNEQLKNNLKEDLKRAFRDIFKLESTGIDKVNDSVLMAVSELEKLVGIAEQESGITGTSSISSTSSMLSKDIFGGDVPSIAKGIVGKVSDFFSSAGLLGESESNTIAEKKFAFGGVVSEPTVAMAGEAGPEAFIPLLGGSVPVTISNDTSVAAVKALVALDDNTEQTNASIDSLSTIADKILTQLEVIDASLVRIETSFAKSTDGVASTSSNIGSTLGLALVSVAGQVASAAVSAYSSSQTTADTSGLSSTDSLSGSSSSAAFSDYSNNLGSGFQSGQYARGGIVSEPTNALIGEGRNSEAIVPLPDNRSIPVVFQDNSGNSQPVQPIQVYVSVQGIRDEGGLNKSANQIAFETARAAKRAMDRNG